MILGFTLPSFQSLFVTPGVSWEFGGPLAGLPPETAWRMLLLIGVVGFVWILISYSWTLVRLPLFARGLLIIVRLFLWCGLLLILASPTRVEQKFAQKTRRPLALLVDRSDSMMKPDHRGQRRLDQALRSWTQLAPSAAAAHSKIENFIFAEKLNPAPTADILGATNGTAGTQLFGSLKELLQQAPSGGWGGVVTLTDGLDTSQTDSGGAIGEISLLAQRAGTPLYFLCGKNLTANGTPFLTFRDMTLPAEVPPKSSFTLVLTSDSYQTLAHPVPVRVKTGTQWQNGPPLFLNSGRHVGLWQMQLSADAPGNLPIEIEVGEGAEKIQLRATVAVIDPIQTTSVLYFEGALDWARKFLVQVLRRDPTFEVSSIVHVQNGLPKNANGAPGAAARLPDSVAGLKKFNVLVLANAGADQFSPAQQKAVTDWVAAGGTMLFLAPDNRAASDYAGTEFERLLPVVFPPRPKAVPVDPEVRAFRARMASLGHSDADAETNFGDYARSTTPVPDLVTFDWEPRAREIFSVDNEMPLPRFTGYARVLRAKPGALVFARHPTDVSPQGDERAILFAMQRYGRGQVAILTCDALWRWKMHEPSNHRAVEQFWQQLFAWLGHQRQPDSGLHFDHPVVLAEVGQPVPVRVSGPEATAIKVTASMDQVPGPELKLTGPESGVNVYQWIPSAPGLWQLNAQNAAGAKASHWVTVRAVSKTPTGELSGMPPDEGVLSSLAAKTGGSILATTAPTAWSGDVKEEPKLVSEHRTRLWHREILFGILLGLYIFELVIRRVFKLL